MPVDTLQAEVEYRTAAAAGDNEGLPDIPQPAVVAVQSLEVREVLRRGQGLGDVSTAGRKNELVDTHCADIQIVETTPGQLPEPAA